MFRPEYSRLIASLPATVPFVAPDVLERISGRGISLRLGANESAFGISPQAQFAILQAIGRISWYGDPESFRLREKLAHMHRVAMGNLVIGSGIDDLLGLVVRAFVEQGTSVVTSLGSYPTFSYHVAGYGGALHFVPYRDYRNDLSGLAVAAIETGARLIYLANPDNPTGSWHGAGCLDTFLHEVPNNCVVLLDEAYGEFLLPEDVLPIIPEDPRVIRLRTFSKAHGMAGARIGYGIAAAEAITAFSKVRVQFGVNSLAQAGALASLDDSRFIASVITAVAEGRDEYYVLGQKLGMPALRSATNFVALDTGSASKAQYIKDSLLQRGVFVRVPGTAPLDQLIRVTVGTPGERTAFAEALRDLAEYLCLPGSEAPNSIESDSHGPGLRGSS